MNNYDGAAKRFFSNNYLFADIFNFKLYNGKQVLKGENLREASTEAFSMLINGNNKYRDILKAEIIRENPQKGKTYILLGIEAQTYLDFTMVVRCMEYDLLRILEEMKQLSDMHKEKKDWKSNDEFLCQYCKEDRLPPVITMVIYLSDKKWDGFRSYWEMLRPLSQEEQCCVNNYVMNIIEPCTLNEEDFAKFNTIAGKCFQCFKSFGTPLEAWKQWNIQEKFLDNQIIEVLNECLGVNMDIDHTSNQTNVSKTARECLLEWQQKGLQEGRQKGLQEGRQKGLQEGRQEGLQEGRQEGLQEGRQKGLQEGTMQCLRQFINGRKTQGVSNAEIQKDLMTIFALPEAEALKLLA